MYQDHSSSLPATPCEDFLPPMDPFQTSSGLRDQVNLSSGTEGLLTIGHPIVFASGQFMGSTIRMELNELQKADLGRKYARVDRRPLDPPPVVQLTIFEVQHPGTEMEMETELNYENVHVSGLICTVDLFPVPDSFAPSDVLVSRAGEATTSSNLNVGQTIFSSPSLPPTSPTQTYEDPHTFSNQSVQNMYPDVSVEWQNQYNFPNDIFPSPGIKVVYRLGNYPITEGVKQTQSLAGATFVQADKVEYQGKVAILFAFSDLAVKIEGAFIMRYRVFDLFSHLLMQDDDCVIGAETYGGPFRVYSTKDFPGLRASTDLTKNLARWGVRLNIRESERRRKKRSDDSPYSASFVSQPRASHSLHVFKAWLAGP